MGEYDEVKAELSRLREESETRLERAEHALAALTRDRLSMSDDDEHDPEGVPLSAEWSRLSGLVASAREDLQRVDDALERIAAGGYGVCAGCGEPIPAARLEVRPFADRCVACA